VSAFNVQNDDYGYMAFYIGTDPKRLDEAEASFKSIIAELGKNELPQKDLARGLAHWEGEYYRSIQGLNARASESSLLALNGYPLDYHRAMLQTASNIKPEDIKKIAIQYLKAEPYKVVVLP